MERLKIGNKYQIHSYKHNGQIYKAWDEATLLNFDFKKGILVFANNCTTVTEKDGLHGRRRNLLYYIFSAQMVQYHWSI